MCMTDKSLMKGYVHGFTTLFEIIFLLPFRLYDYYTPW